MWQRGGACGTLLKGEWWAEGRPRRMLYCGHGHLEDCSGGTAGQLGVSHIPVELHTSPLAPPSNRADDSCSGEHPSDI